MRISYFRTLLNQDAKTPQLVKEKAVNYETDSLNLANPLAITKMLNTVFAHGYESEEVVYLVCFDTKLKPLGVLQVSRGAVNLSVMNPREILIKALICGAVKIAIAHNHPSGNTLPSNADIESSKRLNEACKIIGITLIDSLVVTDSDYYSLQENGLI